MNKIRAGVIGIGSMGTGHLRILLSKPETFTVTAICDIDETKFEKKEAEGIAHFTDYREMIDSGLCDAVVVATPHPCHAEISIYAMEHGLDCICEKPLSECVSKVEKLIDVAKRSGKVFGTNFSMRTQAGVKVIDDLLREKALGDIIRVDFVCTRWLRSQAYYNGQAWRGSWTGEGGGILMNQTPHNLDLLYHWFGEMASVSAEIGTRGHTIEVEDEVSANIMTKAGFPIRFYANTFEAPGLDRIEIVCDQGSIISEVDDSGRHVYIRKLDRSVSEMLACPERMPKCAAELTEVPVPKIDEGAPAIWDNFADAVRNGAPLTAPGVEGIHAVQLANAMVLSHFTGKRVSMPIDEKEYDALLAKLRSGEIKL